MLVRAVDKVHRLADEAQSESSNIEVSAETSGVFVEVVLIRDREEKTGQFKLSVRNSTKSQSRLEYWINGDCYGSFQSLKEAFFRSLARAIVLAEDLDCIHPDRRTYSDGVAFGESWARLASIRRQKNLRKHFLHPWHQKFPDGPPSAGDIWDAIYPDRQHDEDADNQYAAFWDVDEDFADLLHELPDRYLTGFMDGALQTIEGQRPDWAAQKSERQNQRKQWKSIMR